MLAAIQSFSPAGLKPAKTVEKTIGDLVAPAKHQQEQPTKWVRTDEGWREVCAGDASNTSSSKQLRMQAEPHEMHGQCYGFESERNQWAPPQTTFVSEHAARPGYDTMSASEFVDDAEVLKAKVARLAQLVRASRRAVVYAGAGLSTAAGINDYATHNHGAATDEEGAPLLRSPLCAQPTLSHRVLVGLHRSGQLHRLIQQNHDGLPQKAGMPQHAVNEIHGALHAPDNPVIPMSGVLRDDLMADLIECERSSDLVIAVGTSLAGMNADRVVHTANARASRRRDGGAACHGSVLIGLQRTAADPECTLRIFAACDRVFAMLADALELCDHVPPALPAGTFFCPAVLRQPPNETAESASDETYLLQALSYDAMGRSTAGGARTALDLRDGATVVIPTGIHAGATGEVDGYDREGNPRCRFMLRLKLSSKFKAPMQMVVGTWWLQAAFDASVEQLPVVSPPSPDDDSDAAVELRNICAAY